MIRGTFISCPHVRCSFRGNARQLEKHSREGIHSYGGMNNARGRTTHISNERMEKVNKYRLQKLFIN